MLNSITMSKRSILMSIRNPEVIAVSVVVPVLLMLLFVYVIGGAMNVGEGMSYVNYIVPGVILICLGQCSSTTSVSVSTDISKGIISRFRTMPITKSSVVNGYILESVLRKAFVSFIIILFAVVLGFRPTANFSAWLAVIGILLLCCLMLACLSVLFGLLANSPEGVTVFTLLLNVLPYFTSGFAPVESMPTALRVFAEHQPMTPIIETLRALFLGGDLGNHALLAVSWCCGLILISYFISLQLYRNKN